MPTQYLVILDFGMGTAPLKTGFTSLANAENYIVEMKCNPNLKSYFIEKHEYYLIEEWRRHKTE